MTETQRTTARREREITPCLRLWQISNLDRHKDGRRPVILTWWENQEFHHTPLGIVSYPYGIAPQTGVNGYSKGCAYAIYQPHNKGLPATPVSATDTPRKLRIAIKKTHQDIYIQGSSRLK